jgi:hypothetical protein
MMLSLSLIALVSVLFGLSLGFIVTIPLTAVAWTLVVIAAIHSDATFLQTLLSLFVTAVCVQVAYFAGLLLRDLVSRVVGLYRSLDN